MIMLTNASHYGRRDTLQLNWNRNYQINNKASDNKLKHLK